MSPTQTDFIRSASVQKPQMDRWRLPGGNQLFNVGPRGFTKLSKTHHARTPLEGVKCANWRRAAGRSTSTPRSLHHGLL
jgi:hypothetical protein